MPFKFYGIPLSILTKRFSWLGCVCGLPLSASSARAPVLIILAAIRYPYLRITINARFRLESNKKYEMYASLSFLISCCCARSLTGSRQWASEPEPLQALRFPRVSSLREREGERRVRERAQRKIGGELPRGDKLREGATSELEAA